MFLWLVVLGGVVAFCFAWGIGANDVANSFSTSVGARAITLKQAVVIAAIFEFCGAFFLGAQVVETVRKRITDYNQFEDEPYILLLGFFCALSTAATILFIVTKYSMPVSTTQVIVGAIIGFVLVARGPGAVVWEWIGWIVLFWVLSPLMSGLLAMSLFGIMRHFWLRGPHALSRVLKSWGLFVFFAVFTMTVFMITSGIKRVSLGENLGIGNALWISLTIAIGITAALWALVYKPLQKHVEDIPEGWHSGGMDGETPVSDGETETFAGSTSDEPDSQGDSQPESQPSSLTIEITPPRVEIDVTSRAITRSGSHDTSTTTTDASNPSGVQKSNKLKDLSNVALQGVKHDLHANLEEFEEEMLRNAEHFDPKVERAFSWLQVLTASLDILAHGSNDVANSISPFAAMVAIYNDPEISESVRVPLWVLALGALGMVVGLSTYGYKVMKTIGVRMTNVSCSRGYCIELASALVVIIASYFGFPASTTHCQVGATIGVGLLELTREDSKVSLSQVVQWRIVALIFASWIFAVGASGLMCAAFFSFMAYSPSFH